MAGPAPRIAAEDAPSAHGTAFEKAVSFHGLEKILRACRSETAARAGATNGMNDGRNDALITTDEDADEPFHGADGAGFNNRP